MEEIEELENGKLMFHSYEALKRYCDDPDNPLDKVVLGEEITALNSEDKNGNVKGLFAGSDRTNEQFKGIADWNVSKVEDMSCTFDGAKKFNQPLNNWDVSNVESMVCMFEGAKSFNQPIENWDMSNVKWMMCMFRGAHAFNQPLNDWDVSNVTDMSDMFHDAKSFNQPLNNWNVSNVSTMVYMFQSADSFNQPLDNWDLSNKPCGAEDLEKFRQSKAQVIEQLENGKLVFHSYEALKAYCDDVNNPLDKVVLGKEITALNSEDRSGHIRGLFLYSKRTNEQFKGIADWDVSNVEKMSGMFAGAKNFNQPLDNWNVSKVEYMQGMFFDAKNFNQPLDNWDVSNVRSMHGMFAGTKDFNQPLNEWDVSNIKNMECMFCCAEKFNQPLDNWDVSNVTDMHGMFAGAKNFNQPLNGWDVSNVKNMNGMFCGAKTFNQPLNNWDVSNVTDMSCMFNGAERFNQPLSSWGIKDYYNLGLPKNYEDKFKNRDKLLSKVGADTKSKIKLGLESVVNDLNNKKTNTTDCDWIFDDCKEMIIDAVNHKVSLSTIVKVIDTASTYTHTNADGTKKVLKVTITKLTRWLKAQGIEREVRRCAKKVIKKKKTS